MAYLMSLSEIMLVWWNCLLFCVSFTRQSVSKKMATLQNQNSTLRTKTQNAKMRICVCKWAAHQLFRCACVWQMSTTGSVFGTVGRHTIASQTALISWRECLFWLTHVWFVCRERKWKDCCIRLEIAEGTWEIQRCKQKKKNPSIVLNRKLIFTLDSKKKSDTEGWKMQFCLKKSAL